MEWLKGKYYILLLVLLFSASFSFNQGVTSPDKEIKTSAELNKEKAYSFFEESKKLLQVNTVKAKDYILYSYNLARQENIDTLAQVTSRALSGIYHILGKQDSSVFYAKISKQYLSVIDLQMEKIIVNQIISRAYNELGQFDSALIYLDSSEKLIIKNDSLKRKYYTFSKETKGSILKNIGSYDLALKEYNDGLEYAKSINDSKYTSSVLGNIARIYQKIGNNELAIKEYKQIIKIPDSLTGGMDPLVYVFLANSYSELNKIDSAEKYYLKGIEEFKRNVKRAEHIDYSYLRLAEVFYDEDFDKANLYLNSIDTSGLLNEKKEMYYYVSALLLEKDLDLKIKKIEDAHNSIEKNRGTLELRKRINYSLYKLHEQAKNTSLSLNYFKEYNLIKDSISKPDDAFKIQRLIIDKIYKENEEKLASNNILLEEHANKAKSYTFQIIILISLLILSSAVFLFILQKKKRKRLLLEEEKKKLSNDLKMISLDTFKNKEIIEKTKESLKKSLTSKEKSKMISNLYAEINLFISSENQKSETKEKIEKINDDIIKRLDKFGLTKTEKKLAILLILKIETQEIANFLNVSTKTVNIYKYRLRNKIDLDDFIETHN